MSGWKTFLRLLNPRVRRKLKAVRRGYAFANGFTPNRSGTSPSAEEIRNYRNGWQRDGEDWYVRYCQRARLMKRDNRRQQVLVIIDAQTGFISDDISSSFYLDAHKLFNEIKLQIRLARKLGWPILVLTYNGYGDVHPIVLDELNRGGEGSWQSAVKHQRCGAAEVLKLCSEHNFKTNRFRIVGAFTNQCIKATVGGLVSQSPESQIEIVTRACWPNEFGYWLPFVNTKSVLLLPAPIIMPTPLPSAKWWNIRAAKSGIT